MSKKEEKTNVMRLLAQAGIPYTPPYSPPPDGPVDGATVARTLGQPAEKVFKTLVTRGASRGSYYVFVVPVEKELDLKAAARAAGEKSVEMLHVAELLPLTGYVRGGCSPVGMKKLFPTFIDQSAQGQDTIMVSGGRIGTQVELDPEALCALIRGQFAPVAL